MATADDGGPGQVLGCRDERPEPGDERRRATRRSSGRVMTSGRRRWSRSVARSRTSSDDDHADEMQARDGRRRGDHEAGPAASAPAIATTTRPPVDRPDACRPRGPASGRRSGRRRGPRPGRRRRRSRRAMAPSTRPAPGAGAGSSGRATAPASGRLRPGQGELDERGVRDARRAPRRPTAWPCGSRPCRRCRGGPTAPSRTRAGRARS